MENIPKPLKDQSKLKLCPHSLFELNVACKPVLFATLSVSVMFDAVDGRDNVSNDFSPKTLPTVSGNVGCRLFSKHLHVYFDLPNGMTVAKVQRRHDLSEELPGFFGC